MVKFSRKLRKKSSRGKHPNKKTQTKHHKKKANVRHSRRRTRRLTTAAGKRPFLRNLFNIKRGKKKTRQVRYNSVPVKSSPHSPHYSSPHSPHYSSPLSSPHSPGLILDEKGYIVNRHNERAPLDGYSPPHLLDDKFNILKR